MKNSKLLIFILAIILLIVVIKFMKGCRSKEEFVSEFIYDSSLRGNAKMDTNDEKQLYDNIVALGFIVNEINGSVESLATIVGKDDFDSGKEKKIGALEDTTDLYTNITMKEDMYNSVENLYQMIIDLNTRLKTQEDNNSISTHTHQASEISDSLKAPLGRVLWVNECKDDDSGDKRCGTNTADDNGEVLHQLDDKLTDEDEAKLLCKKKAYERNLPYKEVKLRPGFPKGCIKEEVHSETWLKGEWFKHYGLTGSESMWHLIHDNEKHNLYQDTDFDKYKATQQATDNNQNKARDAFINTRYAGKIAEIDKSIKDASADSSSNLNTFIDDTYKPYVNEKSAYDEKQDGVHTDLKNKLNLYSKTDTQKHTDLKNKFNSYSKTDTQKHTDLKNKFNLYSKTDTQKHTDLKNKFNSYSKTDTQKHSELNEDISSYRTDHAMIHATEQTRVNAEFNDQDKALSKWEDIFTSAQVNLGIRIKCQNKDTGEWGKTPGEFCPDWFKASVPK